MNKHALLVRAAKEAIAKVFGDTSVSKEQTLQSMRELMDEVEINIQSLREEGVR